MFIDESFACFLFLWVKRIYFSNLWNERRFEVNGVVIWLMRGKNVMGLFGEYVLEVGAPIRDLLIGDFCSFFLQVRWIW